MKTTNTIEEAKEEFLPYEVDHYVIGIDDSEIEEGRHETLEAAYARAIELRDTGKHFLIDIEAREEDGDMIEVYTIFEDDEEVDDESDNEFE